MSSITKCLILVVGLTLSACAKQEIAARGAPLDTGVVSPASLSVDVQQIRVVVPKTLSVSEANMYYPAGDIVWRGDPVGDRHEQVKAIFETAMADGVSQIEKGSLPVVMDVQVARFHAVSEKARYTIGGVHAMTFSIVLRNPETQDIIAGPRQVRADFRALGGAQAIAAERHGITQKSRITEHLANVIRSELSQPEGHKAARLGLLGAINKM